MNTDKVSYLCRNLLYWDGSDAEEGYFCTITGGQCGCGSENEPCSSYERQDEE